MKDVVFISIHCVNCVVYSPPSVVCLCLVTVFVREFGSCESVCVSREVHPLVHCVFCSLEAVAATDSCRL